MTPKRQPKGTQTPKPPPPPPADSSEYEDTEEEEEEEEEASENTGKQSDSETSDDEQSGEDDSESKPDTPIPKSPPYPAAPVAASTADDGKARVDSLETEGAPPQTSKKSFRRVWSDDDQLALLRGMIDFTELKGKDPVTNITEFCLFVQKSISFPVTESQLVVKIRSLRFKFSDSEGKDKVLTKSSDAEALVLCRKIWGAEDNKAVVENGGKAGARKRKDAGDNKFFVLTHEMVNLCQQNVAMNGSFVRKRINEADESNLKLLEARWKEQKLEEMTVLARKKALQADTLRAMM